MLKERISNYELHKQAFLSGVSLEKIGQEYRLCPYRLGKALKEDGVSIIRNNQKHTYNTEFFAEINSEEKAYWLGFLYADGYVGKDTSMELTLQKQDESHLEKFKAIICPTGALSPKVVTLAGKQFHAVRLFLTSTMIRSQLIKLGCGNRKSLTLRFDPTIMPSELIRHFLRGYFDGDGSVSGGGFYLSGNKPFLVAVQDYLFENVPGYTKVKVYQSKRSKVCTLQKASPRPALLFLHFIYKDSSVYLERKYNKYTKLAEHMPQRAETFDCKSRKKTGKAEMPIRTEVCR